MIAKVVSDSKERMPLQASATSSGMAGIGTIRMEKSSGKKTARNISHPRKKMTRPPASAIRESLERKSSAPKTPRTSMERASKMTGRPQVEGFLGTAANRKRSCHITKAENTGTKKPWEKLGSAHHCCARRPRIGAYSQPTRHNSRAVRQ